MKKMIITIGFILSLMIFLDLAISQNNSIQKSVVKGGVYLVDRGHITRSRNFYDSNPHWENIKSDSIRIPFNRGGLIEFILDPFDPINRAWICLGDPDGKSKGAVWRTDNLDDPKPVWTEILKEVDILKGTGFTRAWVKRIKASKLRRGLIFIVVAGNDNNSFVGRSDDYGASWNWSNKLGFNGDGSVGFELSSHDVNRLWIGIGIPARIFVSKDQGKTFEKLAQFGSEFWHPYDIYVPTEGNPDDKTIFTIVNNRVYRSLDGGDTWMNITYKEVRNNFNILGGYNFGTNDLFYVSYGIHGPWHFIYSSDAGSTFENRFTTSYPMSAAWQDPVDGHFYTGRAASTLSINDPVAFYSNDGGHTWENKTGDWYTVMGLPYSGQPGSSGVTAPVFIFDSKKFYAQLTSAPNDGGDYANSEINFSWAYRTGANSYRLDIATDTTESRIIDQVNVGNVLSYTYNSNLIEDVTYYARIAASMDSGATFQNPSSFSDGITIDRTPPTIYTPMGRLLDDQRVQFVFKATDKHLLARYHIQVATDLLFQTPEIENEISADGIFDFAGTPGLTYYARAYAIDGAGNQSGYSEASNGVSISPLPDLQVTQVQVPPEAWSGQSFEVTWVVSNTGKGSTKAPEWIDRVYLSADTTFQTDIAKPLGSLRNVSYLNPGESYTARAKFMLPQGIVGSFYVFVMADADDNLAESNGSNNVGRNQSPFQIRLTPPPDLQIVSFNCPDNAFSGQAILITWEVKNAGTGKTEASEWSDAVYLSQDSIFDAQQDIKLASFRHSGSLPPDSLYQNAQTIILPQAIYGNYFLIMVADAENKVYEHAWENNNTRFTKIHITLTPPPDLVVINVTIPPEGKSGGMIEVGWTVQNQGPGAPFENSWSDRVWLSKSQQFHADSVIVLGTFTHSAQLPPDSSYDAQHLIRLPNGISGLYYIFVKTDWNNQVFEHQFEDNNLRRSQEAIQVDLSPWPDLQVIQIETPLEALAGTEITVRWTVKNAGTTVAATALWKDRIYISSSPVWNVDLSRQLFEMSHSQPLDTADTYVKASTVVLPADLSGKFYMYVFTDASNSVYEYIDEGNNISRSDSIIVHPYPPVDLAITDISAADSGWSGQKINVRWTVENVGSGRTLVSDWHDGVYLSSDALLDIKNDLLLKRIRRTASLAAGEGYTRQEDIVLPNGISGKFYLFFVVDIDGRVKDVNPDNDFKRAALIVNLAQSPDLMIVSIESASESNSGQPVTVRWIVQNIGSGATPNTTWYDAIFLSTDSRLDQSDKKLGSVAREGIFQPNTTYSESLQVEIPQYASGAYYLIVKTDSRDDIYESGSEANNVLAKLITLNMPPPADLIVTGITIPASASPGEAVSISWTIRNIGQNAATGWIYDAVYVSSDTIWQANDPLVGIAKRYINLAPGKSNTINFTISLARAFVTDDAGNITEQLPGITPGAFHIIVRTNTRHNIRESDLTNNTRASNQTMEVTVPFLQLGITERGTLTPKQMKYYRVEVGEKLNLQIKFSSDVKDACNGVYVAFNRVPTFADFDYAHLNPLLADQQVLIPSTFQGTYYILIYAEKLPASAPVENYALLVEALPFSIFSITPGRGGQGGCVTGKILGAGFEPPIEVFLRDHQGTLISGDVRDLINSTEMIVRWNLQDLSLGIYDVVVKKVDGATVELPQAFIVEPQISDHIFTDVQGPDVLPGGRNAVYEIFVTNANNIDADYIFLEIIVPNYQKFELITNDFFGRPIPEDVLKVLEYPMAAKRIGDVALLICVAKDVPVGKTLHSTLVLYNIKGPPHGFSAIFIKAYALSLEEFLWREVVGIGIIRDEILAADSTLIPKEIRYIIAPDNAAGIHIQSLIQTGLVGDGSIITSTMPLRYDPSRASGGPLADFIDCEGFARSVGFAVDSYFSIISVAEDVAEIALLAAMGTAVPPVAFALLGVKVGFMLYDAYEHNCQMNNDCPDAINNFKSYRDVTDWLITIGTGGPLGFAQKLLFDSIKFMAKNAAHMFCNEIVYAYDPNEIIGPTGFGAEKWITRSQQLAYRINFENDSTLASAPAQIITINHGLDSTIDARTFRLGNFGFGNFNFSIPENRSFYTDRLDIRDSLGLFVDVNFGIDITKNQAFWLFKSIDPSTGQLPINPFSGFLKVNDHLGSGEGFVSFSVRPRSETRTRDLVHAMAKIIFDQNEPIDTPEIYNTIDAGGPISRVNDFMAAKIDTSLFEVNWSAQDDENGSGIGRISLYVAEDDKPFRLYQSGIQDTSIFFAGEMGHEYQFFTVAIDNAGNIEPIKTSGEAKVFTKIKADDPVPVPNKFALHQNYPNPFNPITTIKYELPKPTHVELIIYNILGQKVKQLVNKDHIAGVFTSNWDGLNQAGLPVASGVYLYVIRTPEFSQTKKMIILK